MKATDEDHGRADGPRLRLRLGRWAAAAAKPERTAPLRRGGRTPARRDLRRRRRSGRVREGRGILRATVVDGGAEALCVAELEADADRGYETGAFATIPLRWHDATRTLTVGKRAGGFPGMLARRTFQLVLVTPSRAVPFSFPPKPDKSIAYSGDAISVRF
jgi:hypothetical protein